MKTIAAITALLGVSLVLLGGRTTTNAVEVKTVTRQMVGLAALAAHVPVGSTAGRPAAEATAPEVFPAPADVSDEALTAVVQRLCAVCHNPQMLTGNLSLSDFDVATTAQAPELAERMIRKLRAGMMPPPGIPRPGGDTLIALVETLEEKLDKAADDDPNPGVRTFQRLNRPEYERAILDLLALDVEAGDWLPLDQKSANFDNIADVQALSPTLLDAYLNAASEISRMAVGDRTAPSIDKTYTNSEYISQHAWDHLEGAPYGTRGGMVVDHVFPADAEYVFGMTFQGGRSGRARLDDIDISVNGERVALLHYTRSGVGADGRGSSLLQTEPILVKAGQQRVSAAFVRRFEGPYEDLIRPHDWSLAGGGSGGGGITILPHLKDLVISGPYNVTTVSVTPSRAKIFTCRPTVPVEERPCAEQIISRLGGEAYRRPLEPRDIAGLMTFYEIGAEQGGFEIGVRSAVEATLASPHFVFRVEREPNNARPGRSYDLDDLALASRLSFFLWGAPPDEELLAVADRGKLSDRREMERQVQRMLADPRAEALGARFAGQWLRLQDLYKNRPDPNFYPNFDENLADLMRRETELFFYNLVREDRSALELFSADYTFVNERLARHYRFPNVAGDHFRRVSYPDDSRAGLLGHGSILVLTSLANRTSPVLRGKWVMEVLLGTPPPPPPPGIPDLEETESSEGGVMFTTRQRMEKHRANPVCNACHQFMDPMGLALDNFDVTAKWRLRENGMPLDTRGNLYDGTPVSSPKELADALLKRPIPLLRNFTSNLMAYALGRRVEYYDQPAVRAIVRDAEEEDYAMSSFVLGVVRSDAFQMKRADPIAADNVSGGSGLR